MQKNALLGLTLNDLQAVVKNLGMPGFAARQIASWLYDKRVSSIDEMTNLSIRHRELLKEAYVVGAEPPVDAMRSIDGTVKYLYKVGDGHFVEAVYIPDGERATLCVSSQVGCKTNCKFCMTGKQGFTASLTAGQILNQINSLPEREKLTNVVMMGMGEPLDNLDEVLKALEVMTAPYGYAWSPKRVTLSTVGLRRGLKRFIEECDCHLAVSLHSPLPQQRRELMPAERAFSITEIVDVLGNSDNDSKSSLPPSDNHLIPVNLTQKSRSLFQSPNGLIRHTHARPPVYTHRKYYRAHLQYHQKFPQPNLLTTQSPLFHQTHPPPRQSSFFVA